MKSGIRCYLVFAEKLPKKTGTKLPPSVNELLAWSVTFRCKGTFSNYLGYVRVGCLIEGVSTIAFCLHLALARLLYQGLGPGEPNPIGSHSGDFSVLWGPMDSGIICT